MIISYLFNLIINAPLSFFTSYLIILILIHGFRIKSPWARSCLLALSLFKLLIDPFLYHFSTWAPKSPLLLQTGARMLNLTLKPFSQAQLAFTTKEGTFSLADLIATFLPSRLLGLFTLSLLAISLSLLGLYFYRLFQALRPMKHLIQTSQPTNRLPANQALLSKLEKKKIACVASHLVQSPFAFSFRGKYIFFPSNQSTLFSDEEYEAILAHELSHLSWADQSVRGLLQGISALFWYIPTKWLIKKVVIRQEYRCDKSIQAFGIDPSSLILAIAKTLQKEQTPSLLPNSHLAKGTTYQRIEHLMSQKPLQKPKSLAQRGLQLLGTTLVIYLLLYVGFGRLWIF